MVTVKRKAVEIEAVHYDGTPETEQQLRDWCVRSMMSNPIRIPTALGDWVINPGTWVVYENGDYGVFTDAEFEAMFDVA